MNGRKRRRKEITSYNIRFVRIHLKHFQPNEGLTLNTENNTLYDFFFFVFSLLFIFLTFSYFLCEFLVGTYICMCFCVVVFFLFIMTSSKSQWHINYTISTVCMFNFFYDLFYHPFRYHFSKIKLYKKASKRVKMLRNK